MSVLRRLSDRVDSATSQFEASYGALALLRIAFGVFLVLGLFTHELNYVWMNDVPASLFSPPLGPLALIDQKPSASTLWLVQGAQILVGIWLILGWRSAAASFSATAVLLIGAGLNYSFGKIDHMILVDLLPVLGSLAGWGRRYSMDARRETTHLRSNGFSIFCWALVVSFALFTAVLPKLAGQWFVPNRFGSLYYVVLDSDAGGKPGIAAAWALDHLPDVLWKTTDYVTLAAEGGLILAVLSPRIFRAGILLMCSLHVGIFLLLDISFAPYALVYAPFFCLPVANWFATGRATGVASATSESDIPDAPSRT